MSIQRLFAIVLGKFIFQTTRILKIGGGSAAPGHYSLRIYPNLVSDLSKQIPKTIVITGTNGKTTTARMLGQILTNFGLKVIRNTTGSNLERGIASSLLQHSSVHLKGVRINFDLAIWELDEAAFNTVVPKLKPDMIVFLNIFRDQLDRYGEIDTIVKRWGETLRKVGHKTQVFINGDDQNLVQLQKTFTGRVQTFGLQEYAIEGEKVIRRPQKQKLDFSATNIKTTGLDNTKFTVQSDKFSDSFTLPVPGIYHIYNFLAALAVSSKLQIPIQNIKKMLKNFSPAFGRVEKFNIQPNIQPRGLDVTSGFIFLIKNPAGATQVLQTLAPQIKKDDRLLIALNDNLADGTDVSWIWDVNFELLNEPGYLQKSAGVNTNPPQGWNVIICTGTRAQDLALRLKYAGFDPKQLIVENDLEKAFRQSRKGLKSRLFILPTYTALLKLQAILTKSGLKNPYWQEDKS